MKKIVSGNLLKEKIIEGINLLCDTVKTTLGPKGSNIIIDHSMFSPFITNDGVTIAENIESDDELLNTILTLTKEASIKTNELVGDGTTTTLVLLQSIYNEGVKKINEGINPILLKNELNIELENIIKLIEKESRLPSNENLKQIAKISGSSNTISNIVSEAYKNVSDKNEINLIENDNENTYLEILNGYQFETLIASPYFFRQNSTISYNNPQILLINNNLSDIYTVENVSNEIINKDIPLVIFANDYSDNFINEILSLYFDNKARIVLLKNPEYGNKKHIFYEELNKISNATIITKINEILLTDLGTINKIKIDTDNTIINFKQNKLSVNNISTSTANIYIGAKTTLERRELKMRFDDAISATNEAKKGIIPGSGIILYKISETLKDDNIFKNALKSPLIQILYNSGLDEESIISNLKNSNFNTTYNIITECYEDIKNTSVIDPTSVVINSLKNAVSISSMLLTTTSLIINEHKHNINSTNFVEM